MAFERFQLPLRLRPRVRWHLTLRYNRGTESSPSPKNNQTVDGQMETPEHESKAEQSSSEQTSPTGAPVHQKTTDATPSGQVLLVQPPMYGVRRFFSWLGWSLFFIALAMLLTLRSQYQSYFDTTHGISEKFFSGSKKHDSPKIAILTVKGVIADGSGFVKKQIDRIRDDENVKAVVLRVVSPGGTITGSDFIFHHLTKLREERDLPMVVSMGSIATSGGYYISMAVGDQEKSIYAEPTTTTGSIGVIIPHYDFSRLMDELGVADDSLATHPRKKMLSFTRPITDDDKQVLLEYLNTAFEQFKQRVREGRKVFKEDPTKLDEIATGEIVAAKKAKEIGLIDEIGFIEDAIARAAELAGIDLKAARVIEYTAPPTLIQAIGLSSSSSPLPNQRPMLESLLEFSAPRAYYLSSTIPPLISTYESKDIR